jgi:hypothetical protein
VGQHAKRQFSVKVGTIMEDGKLPLDKWLIAMWLEANSKNSISSYQLARHPGITQKSVWFMPQRIRLAMQNGSLEKLKGTVEADETYVGGLARNMHHAKRKAAWRAPEPSAPARRGVRTPRPVSNKCSRNRTEPSRNGDTLTNIRRGRLTPRRWWRRRYGPSSFGCGRSGRAL